VNKDRYRVLRNGRPVWYMGEHIIFVGKENAQAHIDKHNDMLNTPVYTIEKVEE